MLWLYGFWTTVMEIYNIVAVVVFFFQSIMVFVGDWQIQIIFTQRNQSGDNTDQNRGWYPILCV